MVSLLAKLLIRLALISVALAVVEVTAVAVSQGRSAYLSLPSRIVRKLIEVTLLPLRLVLSVIEGVLGGLKKLLISIFDAVIGVLWSVVPGLSKIPQPKVSVLLD